MKWISAISAAMLFCVGLSAKGDTLTRADFAHKIKLQVSGYTGTETLENFPVLVRVKEWDAATQTGMPGFKYADLTNNKGRDIAFFDVHGNHLASEIQTNCWTTSGESLIWVRLPEIKRGTQFYMCYNTSESGAWVTNENPWEDYVGVWHLDEGGSTGKPIFDSSANALNGTIKATGNSVKKVSDAPVGIGRMIAGDNNHDYGIVVDATNGTQKTAADTLGTDFAASFWMRAEGSASDVAYNFLIDRRKGEQGKSWGVRLHSSGSKQLEIYAADEKPNSGNYEGTLTTANYGALYDKNSGWQKLDIHWRYATNGNQPVADIYLNGAFIEHLTLQKIPAQVDANIGIGGSTQDNPANNNNGGKGRRFKGAMDEVRLGAFIPSADRVKADYDTVANTNFLVAAEALPLGAKWVNETGISNIAYNHIYVGGNVESLGDAETCAVQGKFWAGEADNEPAAWTMLNTDIDNFNEFSLLVTKLSSGAALEPGMTYRYSLRLLGSDGTETVPVSGTFSMLGEAGQTLGSDYTHFYDDGTNAYWVVNEFERYLPFTVTGYTGTETLTNFPVLVDIRARDTNGFDYGDLYHLDGKDIIFVDDTGRIIPHEIDTWNYGGMSLIWVRLPTMNNGTRFTMCYRSALVNPPPHPGNAFERYVGVWHMNEKSNGVVDTADSTENNLVGETHAYSLADSNGRIGYARRVAQRTGNSMNFGRILVFDHDDILRTGVGNTFTYSCWSKLADNSPGWAYLVSRKREDADRGWGIQYNTAGTGLRIWGNSDSKDAAERQFIAMDRYAGDRATGYSHTSWAYWTFVFDNDTFHAYLNGEELASTIGGMTLQYPVANDATADYGNLVIGGMQIGTGAFNGLIDEVRYSKGMRSTDWIKAEYDSSLQVNKPFVTKGAQVGKGPESLVPVVVWRKGAGLPDTVLDVSYAYVQFAGMVTFCGAGADECRIEYLLWPEGEEMPEEWTTLKDHMMAGDRFSIPVWGLKQDMPYHFKIRAVNCVDGIERENREHVGSFRTNGNIEVGEMDGDLLRVGNRFVHKYKAGTWRFTTPDYVTNVEIMVVGGGGAGGYKLGGGGGGGGVFYSTSYPVTTNTTYVINVGTGGKAATEPDAASENGEYSDFALESDAAHPLIVVPGGGAGGSYSDNAAVAAGSDGASGGGGSKGKDGGSAVEGGLYGNPGGKGNNTLKGGADGPWAAGGGGGAGREGLVASSDSWYGGGSGGVGIGCDITGEMLYFGAGGGGGYAYKSDANTGNFTKPGTGGSGIGGNAANLQDRLQATSGVDNTGAGGGGGSMCRTNLTNSTFWQGGDGGDGVVLVAYEVHGRDPIADDPRISMVNCAYDPDEMLANIDYRAYWAGIHADTSDIYVIYSTVSEEAVMNGEGEWQKVGTGLVGIGEVVFDPPETGYTYWVRLVARKSANSFMYSDEVASFHVPAISLNGAIWRKQNSASDDYAEVSYKMYWKSETAAAMHLYCYWSESRESLEGDARLSGDGVQMLDLGTGMAERTTFNLPASEGLKRNNVYYLRLAVGDGQGVKHFLSEEIVELDTIEQPAINLLGSSWATHVATVTFKTSIATLDPADAEVFVFYSTNRSDVANGTPWTNKNASRLSLGTSEVIPNNADTTTSFPLSSTVATTYYVRLAIRSTVNDSLWYSGSTRDISIPTEDVVPANTLIIYANALPAMGCYGDAPQSLQYEITYGGQTEGPGWDHFVGKGIQVVGAQSCAVTTTSKVGQYDIEKGTLALSDHGEVYEHAVLDPVTGNPTGEIVEYYYELLYTGAKYAVTNAAFSAAFDDKEFTYTGESHAGELSPTVSGVRNSQKVSYQYRLGSGEWGDGVPSFTDVGNYVVQFKASAPNHTGNSGTFAVTVNPAPLTATICDIHAVYTGEPLALDVVTNVTGLVRPDLNPLTCSFRDEAGEWMDHVPEFTNPGEYKIFFRAEAPNHATSVTNCTLVIEGWDYKVNMDGETGYKTPLLVSDPGWLIANSRHTNVELADRATRYADLDRLCPNGLRLWQNYLIGRTDFSKKLIASIQQTGDRVQENAFVIRFSAVAALRNAGFDVRFRLDRKLKGESEFTKGGLSDKYDMNVPLGPEDPTGLYLFNVVLLPQGENAEGQSVLASCTTVGVLRVSSAMTNTVMAAPWGSLTIGTEEDRPVSVADVVNPNSVSIDDMILAYVGSGFNAWARNAQNGWDALATVTTNGVNVVDAQVAQFQRGGAFWLVRTAPSDYIYLIGRYTGADYVTELAGGTASSPGHTLVANPTMFDVDMNDLVFEDAEGNAATPAIDDRIVLQNAAGVQITYFRHRTEGKWGRNVMQVVKGRIRQVWTEGGTIPAGTGFWYMRTEGTPLRIRFGAVR